MCLLGRKEVLLNEKRRDKNEEEGVDLGAGAAEPFFSSLSSST